MRFVRDNGLSIFFLAIFLFTLAGQAIAGHGSFNHDQLLHHGSTISFGRYLTTSEFAADVAENWQSEYLQFTLYILLTVWFVQRGSPESKKLGEEGRESDEDQRVGEHARRDSPRWAGVGGARTRLYSNSLLIVMGTIWPAAIGSSALKLPRVSVTEVTLPPLKLIVALLTVRLRASNTTPRTVVETSGRSSSSSTI